MNFPFRGRTVALAGAGLLAACGAALLLGPDNGRAEAGRVALPAAEQTVEAPGEPPVEAPLTLPPPAAAPDKEARRFARSDRDDDGEVSQSEYLAQRRRNFDGLDTDGDGRLSFAEYAVKGIARFTTADADRDGRLEAAEFATTAPKARKAATAKACRCPADAQLAAAEGD